MPGGVNLLAERLEIYPGFMGDVFSEQLTESLSDNSVTIKNTNISVRVQESVRGLDEIVEVAYHFRANRDFSLELNVIGENIIVSLGKRLIDFEHTYVAFGSIEPHLKSNLKYPEDFFGLSDQMLNLPLNRFSINIAKSTDIELLIKYTNSRKDFFQKYGGVNFFYEKGLFRYWNNPSISGLISVDASFPKDTLFGFSLLFKVSRMELMSLP